MLDELHRGHHLADALSGEVLEVAGLENADHAVLDFFAEPRVLVRRCGFAEGGRGLIDRFRGLENLLGGFFGAADHGAEFAGDLGHFIAAEALAVKDGDFLLGAGDGVVNKIEFDLQLFALFDLRAIAAEQLLGGGEIVGRGGVVTCVERLGRGHLRADGAQFAHDLMMLC